MSLQVIGTRHSSLVARLACTGSDEETMVHLLMYSTNYTVCAAALPTMKGLLALFCAAQHPSNSLFTNENIIPGPGRGTHHVERYGRTPASSVLGSSLV